MISYGISTTGFFLTLFSTLSANKGDEETGSDGSAYLVLNLVYFFFITLRVLFEITKTDHLKLLSVALFHFLLIYLHIFLFLRLCEGRKQSYLL